MPLALAHENTVVLLAGDPHQLGPKVHHAVASRKGLGTSWIDRLLQMDLYDPAVRKAYLYVS